VKNYYLILGVSRSESPEGIRSRYRTLARALHPDVAGAESTRAFQEISEAYRVLADPVARRRYNSALAHLQGRQPVGAGSRPSASPADPASPFAERHPGLDFEVILTPGEARRGAEVPVGLPRPRQCPECHGTGRIWFFPCLACGEQGVIEGEEIVRIRIPPLVRERSLIEVVLHGPGRSKLYLRLHVRIDHSPARHTWAAP
jgi:DnaJ-class molecular chaperone